VPPVGRQARKACARGDQSIDGIEITLQVVELASYRGFYFSTTRLFLFGDSEEIGMCLAAVILGFVFVCRSELCSHRSSMIRSVDSLASLSNFRSVG